MGSIMYGKCEVCGRDAPLQRKCHSARGLLTIKKED